MRAVQDILYGVTGQTLYFDAPEGRPSSVTSVSVWPGNIGDTQTAEVAAGTPSVETSPNTTLDAASGPSQPNPRNISLSVTTGSSIDRSYLITHTTSGLREFVEVESVTSADSVTVKHPLHNDYASGATFQSTRMTATVDSTWVADEGNLLSLTSLSGNPMYRVRWVYVVNSVTYVADAYFNLVRYAASHGVRPQDIEAMQPGWLDSLPTDHYRSQGRALIDDAYRAVKIDLRQVDVPASSLAESEITDELVRYKALSLGEWARYMTNGDDETRATAADKRYTARLDALVRVVSRVPVRDHTGAATQIASVGLERR